MINIFSFTNNGASVQKRVIKLLKNESIRFAAFAKYNNDKDIKPLDFDLREYLAANFDKSQALIFIGAVGIAVRYIAPFIKSKDSDAAVIVIDEHAKFVIPILSGHTGGANELATRFAKYLDVEAVITTATDLNEKFSIDDWARGNGFYIAETKFIKDISAVILRDEKVGMLSDFPIKGNIPDCLDMGNLNNLGIYFTNDVTIKPFKKTLHVLPKIYSIGLGCKKNTPFATVESVLNEVFVTNGLDIKRVLLLSSIDLKFEEKAIIELSYKLKVKFVTFSAEELNSLKGDFTKSDFVKWVTGVDNICERSALKAVDGCGKLIVRKYAKFGVTVAVAETDLINVNFGE